MNAMLQAFAEAKKLPVFSSESKPQPNGQVAAELIGRTFGRLTVVSRAPQNKGRWWNCACECGKATVASTGDLKSGHKKSCGCLFISLLGNNKRSHGLTGTRIYNIWNNMKRRCLAPSCKSFVHYGGRGIKVCDRWMIFENFVADMGHPPGRSELDRIDNDGNYEPVNCRWTDRRNQVRNTRSNVFLEYRGERACIAEWAERFNIKPRTLHARIFAQGYSVDKALNTPIKPWRIPK